MSEARGGLLAGQGNVIATTGRNRVLCRVIVPLFSALAIAPPVGGLGVETPEIPSLTLCDLARSPGSYFDRTVRLTATFEQWTEGQYFTDVRCPLSHDNQIGAGWTVAESDRPLRDAFIQRLHSPGYQGRARVTVTGVLRNEQARHFYWYGSRFDIVRIESHAPAVETYRGELESGREYVAEAVFVGRSEVALTPPPRIPLHHALRIEWTGLEEASVPRGKVTISFRVLGKQVIPAGPGRWNTTVTCALSSPPRTKRATRE